MSCDEKSPRQQGTGYLRPKSEREAVGAGVLGQPDLHELPALPFLESPITPRSQPACAMSSA
jgi:hypothetical protein